MLASFQPATRVEVQPLGQTHTQNERIEIPSHDTIARLFATLDPEALQKGFLSWVRAVTQLSEGAVIAIDRKTLRHAYAF